jgi:hypothetical protein
MRFFDKVHPLWVGFSFRDWTSQNMICHKDTKARRFQMLLAAKRHNMHKNSPLFLAFLVLFCGKYFFHLILV